MASHSYEVNKFNTTDLFMTWTKIVEIERSEESQKKNKTETERHIKAMIDEIPWVVGADGERLNKGTLIGRFDQMATELRDDEVLKIASGEPVPSLKVDWPEELPSPKKKVSKLLTDKDAALP
jgi:hypothetical protein